MTDEELLARLESEMGVLVRRLRRRLLERAQLVHPELLAGGYTMLVHLQHTGPQRASALAETFALDKGAVSRYVQQLLDLGLVERTPDPSDGRASIIAISRTGLERVESVTLARRLRLSDLLEEWDDKELADFVSSLARYNRTLG